MIVLYNYYKTRNGNRVKKNRNDDEKRTKDYFSENSEVISENEWRQIYDKIVGLKNKAGGCARMK